MSDRPSQHQLLISYCIIFGLLASPMLVRRAAATCTTPECFTYSCFAGMDAQGSGTVTSCVQFDDTTAVINLSINGICGSGNCIRNSNGKTLVKILPSPICSAECTQSVTQSRADGCNLTFEEGGVEVDRFKCDPPGTGTGS